MVRRLPRSTLFPTRRSSDLGERSDFDGVIAGFGGVSEGVFEFPSLEDRKSTRLNSSHVATSYAVFSLKKKTTMSITTLKSGNNSAEARNHCLSNCLSAHSCD